MFYLHNFKNRKSEFMKFFLITVCLVDIINFLAKFSQ